jgi:hypothetical protein
MGPEAMRIHPIRHARSSGERGIEAGAGRVGWRARPRKRKKGKLIFPAQVVHDPKAGKCRTNAANDNSSEVEAELNRDNPGISGRT